MVMPSPILVGMLVMSSPILLGILVMSSPKSNQTKVPVISESRYGPGARKLAEKQETHCCSLNLTVGLKDFDLQWQTVPLSALEAMAFMTTKGGVAKEERLTLDASPTSTSQCVTRDLEKTNTTHSQGAVTSLGDYGFDGDVGGLRRAPILRSGFRLGQAGKDLCGLTD